MTKIYSVTSLNFDSRNPGGGKFKVMAEGKVSTGGWTNVRLERLRSKDANGFQMYRFLADPPPNGTIVTQGMVDVAASDILEAGQIGVSVEASTNTMTLSFSP